MKKVLSILVLALCCCVAKADPNVTITNWISGYTLVYSGVTNLVQDEEYICIPVDSLTFLGGTNYVTTNANSDVRLLLYGVVKHLYNHYNALASTNKPTMLVLSEGVGTDSSGEADLVVKHSVQTKLNLSTISVPSE